MTARSVRIENEIELKAPPERAFAAMTTEQQDWYPHNYGGDRLKAIVFEEKVGGLCYEDWGEGAGTLYSIVAYFDPPKAYCTRGHLRGGITLEQWAFFEPSGEGTLLKHSMVCFGDISDEEAEQIRIHGDLSRFKEELSGYLARTTSKRS